ncbi:zinc finger protein ZXDC [Corythoichthys intestinalis]|uniref:zinc finger protein ZXDC n=1 Tax=Corythoichthys intestinalis TaxID=161448 RepID=UPI0025A5D58C|nr:zinc finger protein ZXDC [Corythoichthys intestinalis]
MEMQGLSDAQNIHSQHGDARTKTQSALGPVSGGIHRFLSPENEAELRLESPEFGNDNSRVRARLSPLRLLAENGSEVAFSPFNKLQLGDKNGVLDRGQTEALRNVNTEQEGENIDIVSTSNFGISGQRSGAENLDSIMQMALLTPEGEEEPTRHQRLTLPMPVLLHPRGNGAPKQPSVGGRNDTGAEGKESKNNAQELYVVFNVFQEDRNGDRLSSSSKIWDKMKRRGLESSKATNVELGNAGKAVGCSNELPNRLDSQCLKKPEEMDYLVEGSSAKVGPKQVDNYHTVEDAVLADTYDEEVCAQMCTETNEENALRDLSFQERNDDLISTNLDIVETMEASQLILDSAHVDANSTSLSSGLQTNETFSGTLMINNQTIIVTIDNGTLTLAAPTEEYVHREDDLVSLKEHLGVKDHEDIVLLNYDSGTKAIGKISTLAVSSHQEEAGTELSVCDSELSVMDNISLPMLSTPVNSCSIIKQEAGVLHEITGAEVTSSPKPAITNKDSKCGRLIRANKVIAVSFTCPDTGCSCTFDTRQKLKVHLLNHAEDPRPYQCTVEGCGWAFATAYKLKRHLQSHNKQRPHTCHFEGCGRCFTTVYNLKAHTKVHEQEDAFICEVCNERFRSATRLGNHQRVHFEPQRPHKCEFPGCEKTFITFSALYSHNRTHFRETGHFTCTYPGCGKMYDKACRLKIHLRSHTGERPFVCDSEGCGWSFTSMSKLLRHKRKHDDDRRFVCTEEGCGKSFTRAEHLKGHSITHLGTKPFQCHVEGCNVKFSARSSLYIHTKKHKQDTSIPRTRCPVADCSKQFSSRSTLRSHMLKQHQLSPDAMTQMETTPTLTPSSELVSPIPVTVSGSSIPGSDQLTNLDLSSLFSNVPGSNTSPAGVGIPISGSTANSNGTLTMDLSMVSSSILTIDQSTVGTALCTSDSSTLARPMDPLILTPSIEMGPHHSLGSTVGDVLPPQGTLNLDDVQSVTPEALGALTSLSMQGPSALTEPTLQHQLSSSNALVVESSASVAVAPVAELISSSAKMVENGGSARTDYRAIQLAKRKKQICPSVSGGTGPSQRKSKGVKSTPSSARHCEGPAPACGGLLLRDSVSGTQFVQIQLLQDDPASDGDLAFQLSSQPSASHSQLTVDLPVNILQETTVITEENSGSDNSQFTGSTINLQDLE